MTTKPDPKQPEPILVEDRFETPEERRQREGRDRLLGMWRAAIAPLVKAEEEAESQRLAAEELARRRGEA